jgi:SOS response regulatory protein OraA/RecX
MSQQINLFDEKLLKQKDYFSLLAMLQALGLILLGSVLFYGYAVYQVKQLAIQSAESQTRYDSEVAKLARYTADFSPQLAQQQLEKELSQAEAEAKAQRELILRMKSGGLGNTKGYSEYMRAFARQTVYGLWLTGFEITGDAVQMKMQGAALSPEAVPSYIKRLRQEKAINGKEFAALQMQQHKYEEGKPSGRAYLEFTLQTADAGGDKK